MKLRGYRVSEDRRLEPISVDQGHLPVAPDAEPRWLDIEGAQADELEALLKPLELNPFILQHCLTAHRPAHVIPFDESVYVDYPLRLDPSGNALYVRFLALPSSLLTIRDGAAAALEGDVAEHAAARLRAQSVAGILYRLLDIANGENLAVSMKLRDDVIELAQKIEVDAASIVAADIQSLKRRAGLMQSLTEDQLACVSVLRDVAQDTTLTGGPDELLRHTESRQEHLTRLLARLGVELQDLQQQYAAALQDKTNRRLNVLTVVQAVFVPLTLIAGLYGMNFDTMPELHWPGGYYLALASMAAIAAGELLLFYHHGWFD